MGRGNVCTHNEYEGLYYLDHDLLDIYRKVERCDCGHVVGFDYDEDPRTAQELSTAGIQYDYDSDRADWSYDEDDSRQNWRDMIAYMRGALTKRFPSFKSVNTWRGCDQNVVLRSGLFEIAVVDGDWCAAWCLLERTDVDDTGSYRALMRRHYMTYLDAIKKALIDGWGEAIGYGGAWVSGRRYMRGDVA